MLDVKTDRADLIAFASSQEEGRPRWTELRLYYRDGERRPFLAETVGASSLPGETDRTRQRVAKTLDAALSAFDNSALSASVAAQGQAWLDARGEGTPAPRIQFDGAGGLRGALDWLYPVGPITGGATPTEGGLSMLFESDWGIPARTVRHTLKLEREGTALPSWCKAFLGALQHFDRAAFHAARRPAQ